MADTLLDDFLGGGNKSAVNSAGGDTSLLDSFLSPPVKAVETVPEKTVAQNLKGGFKKGLQNVAFTARQGLGLVDKFIGGKPSEEADTAFEAYRKKENETYAKEYGESGAAEVGKIGGEIAATLPIVPAKVVQGVNIAARALPITLATGERLAAPLINRLGAAAGVGAVAGGVYGGATSGGNDNSLGQNIGEGIITGAIGGPAIHIASKMASSILPRLWASVNISKLSQAANMPVSAIKNIIGRLEDAGLTPQDAQVALNKLGGKATLMDLDRALTTEGSGLAAMGGKPTSILKGRMDARADTANSDAVKIFESRFGPKPDVYMDRGKIKGTEADNIVKEARRLTSGDYQLAHNSPQKLDTTGITASIDQSLENAVGVKKTNLNEIRSYLFKPNGSLKTDVASLHEARQGIDDIINKKGESLPPNALRAVSNIRDLVDTVLKTNNEMKAADAKFAERMKVREGLGIGYKAIANGMNKDEFIRVFNKAPDELKETIKKGMHAATIDLMEKSAQGQLTGAERLFGKKDVNRVMFKHAFGNDAEDILDEIHRDIMFRNTERAVTSNSLTAERQAVRNRYETQGKGGILSEAVKGLAVDVATGSSGGAASVMAGRRLGGNILVKMSDSRLGRLVEGSADLLSKRGAEAQQALSTLGRVKLIQDKMKKRTSKELRLPITLSAPVGEIGYNQYKKLRD